MSWDIMRSDSVCESDKVAHRYGFHQAF